MYIKENEKVSQIVWWIRENLATWDLLCGDSWCDPTIRDSIDMLEKLVESEMYQLALILIVKMDKCKDMDKAISNVIVNRINEPNPNIGIITEVIKEFKIIANQKDIMDKELSL